MYTVTTQDGARRVFGLMLDALAFICDGGLTASVTDNRRGRVWYFVEGKASHTTSA